MLRRLKRTPNPVAMPGRRGWFRRWFPRLFRWAVWAAVATAVLVGGTNGIVMGVANGHIVAQDKAQKAEAIIVPGAKVWQNGQPSYMLQDRLDVAYELYAAGVAPKILVSGDHGQAEYDEVNNMRRYLEDRGVPTEDIFMDHAGFDTYDTMYRAGAIFGVKNAVVVTQRYHLYRAVYLGLARGIDVQGVACDRYRSPYQWYFSLREAAARSKDLVQALLRLGPKYLGDEIPISGSGVTTHDGDD